MLRAAKLVLLTCLIAPLAACMSVLVDVSFEEDEMIDLSLAMKMSHEAYGLIASMDQAQSAGFCEGAQVVFAKDHVSCVTSDSVPLQEALRQASFSPNQKNDLDRAIDGELRQIGLREVEMTLPLNFEPSATQDIEFEGMDDLFLAALAGELFELRISGAEILETNGILENDGRAAAMYIPMIEILKPSGHLPEAFYVRLRY